MATAASILPAANAASNLPRKATIRALGAVSSMVSSRWIDPALPEGSAKRKTARVSRRWQAATLRLSASVQGAYGGERSPDRRPPPALLKLAPFGLVVQPKRELVSKENQRKML